MKYEEIIQKSNTWIESRLDQRILSATIAASAGFSMFHFHRIFQASTGMSVSKYIRMRRLTNAASALLHTDERIIDIAPHYQFESQEAFTRAFKKLYHLPPGQYRKLMTNITHKRRKWK